MPIWRHQTPGYDFQGGRSLSLKNSSFYSPSTGDWNLVLVLRGEGALRVDEARQPFVKGDLLLRCNDRGCHFEVTVGTDLLWFGLVPKQELLQVGKQWGSTLPGILHYHLQPKEFRKVRMLLIESFRLDLERRGNGNPLAYSLTESVILRVEYLASLGTGPNREKEPQMELALRLLADPENRQTPEEIARKCGFSRSVFFRKFREATGCTPRAYREKLRFREALRQLRETDLPISTIAAQCGFGELCHFSARFKQIFRLSPKEYRKGNTVESGK